MHTLTRIALLSSVLVSLAAGAQVPKPRVMIILDTSRSMMQYPTFTTCPACSDNMVPVTEAAGGDYNMATDNNCVSKFCVAKKAVNQVLPAYTGDARIGLATYYQYIIQADSTNTLNTTCSYDVFSAPNVRKSFTSLTDYTGSGSSTCAGNALSPDTTCTPGTTRTSELFFPDSSLGGGGAGLKSFCPMPTGVSTPATWMAPATACGADTRNCYVLTKTGASPSPIDCDVYTWPLPSFPATFTSIVNNGAGCQNNLPYDTAINPVVYTTVMPRTEQIVGLGTLSCPAAVTPTTNPGATPPSVTLTATPTIGSAVGNWRNFGGASERCSAQNPCSFFSYSTTPVSRFGSTAWYGFFDNTFTPANTLSSLSGTYQFSQYNAGSAAYTPTILTGSVTLPNGTGCLGGGWPRGTNVGTTTRYTSGSLSGSFGVNNAQTTLDSSAVARGARTDDTPTRTGTNYTCSAAYPCDVRLSNDVDLPGAWVNNVATIYADVYNPVNERTTPIASDTFNLRLLLPAVSCPASIGTNGAAPANSVWTSAPGGCTGAGAGACSFTSGGMGAVATTTTCPNVVRWSNLGALATPPANCAFNNKAYTGPTTSANQPVTQTITSGSCTMGTFEIAAAGSFSGCGGFPCKLTYVSNNAGPADSSSWGLNIYNRTAAPAGWSGTAVRDQNVGGLVNGPVTSGPTPTCLGSNSTWVTSTDASLCPGGVTPCTLWQSGPAVISMTCGPESKDACRACQYQQKRFQWDRPTTQCNYTANSYTYTVNQTAPTCNYTRARWQLDRRNPDQHRCDYQVGARRYDFAPPTEKVCEYWSVKSTLRASRNLYTYEYKTKGTELIGRASARTFGAGMCGANSSSTYSGALETACPATSPCSAFGTMLGRTNSLGGGNGAAPAGSTCKLSWGAGDSPSRVYGYTPYASAGGGACASGKCLTGDSCSGGLCYTTGARRGRAQYFNTTENFQNSPTNTSSRLCEEDPTSLPASPDSYQVAKPTTPVPPGFCTNGGIPSGATYSLVSDYYNPAATNNLSAYTSAGCVDIAGQPGPPPTPTKPCFRTSGAAPIPYQSVSWTQAAGATVFNTDSNNKLQGFGGRTGVSAPPSGDVPAVSTFVPIPDDLSYNEITQANRLRAATTLCIMPNADVSPADGVQDGPNADGSLRGGACVADFADRAGGIDADYTPLLGSIKNAADYLTDRWNTDPEPNGKDCRDYFIILATDGVESTPVNYTLTGTSPTTSVQGLVSSLRNTSTAFPRTAPDIRTFVIGFGDGAASAGVGPLNAVASAGGTTNAYFPSTLADLQNTLNAVFTTILAGQESRSKPAIGTDGTRIYAAQYVKPLGSGPDWYGLFTAYAIDPVTGAPSVAWDHHAKLNDPGHPSRTIKGVVDHNDHTHGEDFEPGMNFRDTRMDTRFDFNNSLPDGGTPNVNDVINFLRARNQPYDRTFAGSVVYRASALGPIVNSSPVVVGKSPFDDAYGGTSPAARTSFRAFMTGTSTTRGTRIYFAANDGMIHSVIDNSTAAACSSESSMACPNGREDWSVVPMNLHLKEVPAQGQPTLGESLFKLKSTGSWAMNMLNGPVSVADVCNENSDFSGSADNCATNRWKTVLIGTMREGGRGMIALDITDHSPPSGTSNGSNNGVLWDFEDGNLGLTYSAPAIGRVRYAGNDKFVAFFGGGADDPVTGPMEGDAVFVVDALRRNVGSDNNPVMVANLWQYQRGGIANNNLSDTFVARPASYRRAGSPYMDSGYIAGGKTLYAIRFAQPDGTQWNNRSYWQPDEFFDPTSTRNDKQATNAGVNTPINRVVKTYAGNIADPNDPPTYALSPDGALPLAVAPPILNRAKLSNSLVATGKPDLFVGTGNSDTPNSPGVDFKDANYFYAVHDFNDQSHGALNDGRALWVAKFCNGEGVTCTDTKEQIVSEPAVISSCVIVPTYTPFAGSSCGGTGSARLYGFNAITGALTSCLVFPPGSPWAGQATSVVELGAVGIPSDLVVINDNLYFTTSNTPGVNQVPVKQNPTPGAVRSYRRLK
ncbi:MAG: hypothetical protein IAE78_30610 [Myxococcus sp.]|nr:hypothetical protein [Myxococcus sp.]